VAVGQSQRFYSGVGIFNWYYLSSPPQIPRGPWFDLESRWLISHALLATRRRGRTKPLRQEALPRPGRTQQPFGYIIGTACCTSYCRCNGYGEFILVWKPITGIILIPLHFPGKFAVEGPTVYYNTLKQRHWPDLAGWVVFCILYFTYGAPSAYTSGDYSSSIQ
jgi:hypothetical protein